MSVAESNNTAVKNTDMTRMVGRTKAVTSEVLRPVRDISVIN